MNEEGQFEVLRTSCLDDAIIIKMKTDAGSKRLAVNSDAVIKEHVFIWLTPTSLNGYWGSNLEPSRLGIDPSATTLKGAVGVI